MEAGQTASVLRLAVVTCLVLACGDNLRPAGPALQQAADLFVVAHPDDDLLLIQPDVLRLVQGGAGVTTVYVTAGNGKRLDVDVAARRYEGVKAAYAYAAAQGNWTCGAITIAGHFAEHCQLPGVSLVFLGYPDGGKDGEYPASLLRLWHGEITSATTIASEPTRYDRDGLVDVLAGILQLTRPTTVRTLEITGSHGRDHPDHHVVGALTVLAVARANVRPELLSFRGYGIADEPPNKQPIELAPTLAMLGRYEACATDCGTCGEGCDDIDPMHVTWLQRSYPIGFRPRGGGVLRLGERCLGDSLALGSCTGAPIWKIDPAGELRVHDRCLTVDPDGALSLGSCVGGRERRFFVDDEGHILAGMPPTPGIQTDGGDDGLLWCLDARDGRGALVRCGSTIAPAWELVPPSIATPRIDLGLAATGRNVRLGDLTGDHKADLCAIENGLVCAAGGGLGGFLAAIRIDDPGAPLAIDADSLVLGDVDGDHRIDACGRDDSGILCATAASGFAAERWSPAFGAALARTTSAASLAAVDADGDGIADLCGVDRSGVVCAARGLTFEAAPRSTWPAPDALVWPADLDGDGMADWCVATNEGPACALEAERDLTTDGAPWGYAQSGRVDIVPESTATVALADIDGDRRADLCVPRGDRVSCARSLHRRFGPRSTTLAILPDGESASALWLGDLDGDGRMDPCVDLGATIACAVQP